MEEVFMTFEKMFFKPQKKTSAWEVILKVFLVVGIVAGVCVVLKIVYDKYKNHLSCLCCGDDDLLDEDILDECYCCCDDEDCLCDCDVDFEDDCCCDGECCCEAEEEIEAVDAE